MWCHKTLVVVVASGWFALAWANPVPLSDESCRICLDLVNECQNMYGGCWNFCTNPTQVFDIPACNGVSGTKQVCEKFKNECGEIYGGCYPAEGPIPLWAVPACPAVEDPPQPDPTCQICVDQITDCGQMYGGCYDFCAAPSQTFAVPACNGVSGKNRTCEYFKNECGEIYGGCYPAEGPMPQWAVPLCPAVEDPPQPDPSCQICVDQINDCGRMYGGCYDFCAEPEKKFDIPACNGVSGKQDVCSYSANACGKVFGQCYPAEGPIPLPVEVPACP